MIKTTCLELYFNPIYLYIKRSFELAIDNNFAVTIMSGFIISILKIIECFFEIRFFGVPNLLLFLVILTVLIDAYWGIKKSKRIAKEALLNSRNLEPGTLKHKKELRVYELKKFRPEKLQFTFFKCLTLLGYLFFAKTLLNSDEDGMLADVIGFTSAVILKIPLAIFWYYDFKSIGNNAAYVHGKKASIFKIVESIFEIKLSKYLKNNKDKK